MNTLPTEFNEKNSITDVSEGTKAKVYVVYCYVDYRKEIGTRILRTYSDREKAIEWVTKFAKQKKTEKKQRVEDKKEVDTKDEENEEKYDDYQEDGPEYSCEVGTDFDAYVVYKKKKDLVEETGLDTLQDMFGLRIAIDCVECF